MYNIVKYNGMTTRFLNRDKLDNFILLLNDYNIPVDDALLVSYDTGVVVVKIIEGSVTLTTPTSTDDYITPIQFINKLINS